MKYLVSLTNLLSSCALLMRTAKRHNWITQSWHWTTTGTTNLGGALMQWTKILFWKHERRFNSYTEDTCHLCKTNKQTKKQTNKKTKTEYETALTITMD